MRLHHCCSCTAGPEVVYAWQGDKEGTEQGMQTGRQLQLPAPNSASAAAPAPHRAYRFRRPSAADLGLRRESFQQDSAGSVAAAAAAAAQAASIAAMNVALKAQRSRELGMQRPGSLQPGSDSGDGPAACQVFLSPDGHSPAPVAVVEEPAEVQHDLQGQVRTWGLPCCQDA